MARSDYERPSADQIQQYYQCDSCGQEASVESWVAAPTSCSACGGHMRLSGESYPADPDDWNECRDNYYDDWRSKW